MLNSFNDQELTYTFKTAMDEKKVAKLEIYNIIIFTI
jgi:hypothetical protein